MQEIQKMIRQLTKSLKKVREIFTFVHDIKTLNSSYDLDYEDKRFQEELRKQYLSLKQQRKNIKHKSDSLIAKMDEAIEQMEHFLQ